MFAKYFWADPAWWGSAIDRMIRSAAQALAAAILADQIGWFNHFYQIAITVGTMTLLSLLSSIVMAGKTGDRETL